MGLSSSRNEFESISVTTEPPPLESLLLLGKNNINNSTIKSYPSEFNNHIKLVQSHEHEVHDNRHSSSLNIISSHDQTNSSFLIEDILLSHHNDYDETPITSDQVNNHKDGKDNMNEILTLFNNHTNISTTTGRGVVDSSNKGPYSFTDSVVNSQAKSANKNNNRDTRPSSPSSSASSSSSLSPLSSASFSLSSINGVNNNNNSSSNRLKYPFRSALLDSSVFNSIDPLNQDHRRFDQIRHNNSPRRHQLSSMDKVKPGIASKSAQSLKTFKVRDWNCDTDNGSIVIDVDGGDDGSSGIGTTKKEADQVISEIDKLLSESDDLLTTPSPYKWRRGRSLGDIESMDQKLLNNETNSSNYDEANRSMDSLIQNYDAVNDHQTRGDDQNPIFEQDIDNKDSDSNPCSLMNESNKNHSHTHIDRLESFEDMICKEINATIKDKSDSYDEMEKELIHSIESEYIRSS